MTATLKLNYEFQKVYKKGRFKAGKYTVVYCLKNAHADDANRLGISVGKKFGNSVQRNRIKRLIREVYRSMRDIERGYDIVISVKPSKRESATSKNRLKAVYVPSYAEISEELRKLFLGVHILKTNTVT